MVQGSRVWPKWLSMRPNFSIVRLNKIFSLHRRNQQIIHKWRLKFSFHITGGCNLKQTVVWTSQSHQRVGPSLNWLQLTCAWVIHWCPAARHRVDLIEWSDRMKTSTQDQFFVRTNVTSLLHHFAVIIMKVQIQSKRAQDKNGGCKNAKLRGLKYRVAKKVFVSSM